MLWRRRVSGEEGAPAGFAGRRRIALGGAAAVAIVAGGLWVERRPIAEHFIDGELAARGVPARYTIADLGPGRQRLTDVVIGDPRAPDLVADWIETETSVGFGGASLTGVRAGHVRVRGRLVDGRLSLGALDRLVPASSGGGGLPALSLDVADARLTLATPAGAVTARLAGKGRLDRDFDGRLAIAADRLASGGCLAAAPHAVLRIRTTADAIALTGPATSASVGCAGTVLGAPSADVDVALPADRSRWQGTVRIAAASLADPRGQAQTLAGSIRFAGSRAGTGGTVAIEAQRIAAGALHAARGTLAGRFAIGPTKRFDAELAVSGASVAPEALAGVRRGVAATAGSPVAPLAGRAGDAMAQAARGFGGTGQLALVVDANGVQATLTRAALVAGSGATARFEGAVPLGTPHAARGSLSVSGGGLPTLDLGIAPGRGGTLEGALVAAPYAAGGARLALAPAAFAWAPGRSLRIATSATLSGPLAGGSVEGLNVPLAIRVDARGVASIGEGCQPVGFDSLAVGSLRLAATKLTLCPTGPALLRIANGGVEGGATTGPVRLAGRLGDSPLDVTATGLRAGASGELVATGLTAALGTTHLTATQLGAHLANGAVAGTVAGLGGRIGEVPLILADGTGQWRFAGGTLALDGTLTVLDAAAADPRACTVAGAAAGLRFCPMLARDVALRLGDGRITATGTLAEPTTGTRVATLAIDHDLASGAGYADLAIKALSFDPRFQPDRLTPIVEGVIENVAGTVDGTAHIAWNGSGVTSTGRFATAGLDLAAAVGPVSGIAGSIDFTDLLSLTSAPGQVLTVRSINPGIAVENGTVRFHTEPGVKVAVEDARWPFAGGTLSLDQTLLDFSAPAERHMTFRLDGVAADRFLQQFDFKNLTATGTFDGVLPMVFDAEGGRIENGRLTVRENGPGANEAGGGTLAYVGDVSQKDVGFWGNLAFQALKSLRYRSLAIAMNGPLAGEMVTEVRFAGVSQGQGAKSNFLIRRLQRLPFVFNVTIKAPFRTLLDGLDPVHQAQLNLPRLIDAEKRAPSIQPPASEPVR